MIILEVNLMSGTEIGLISYMTISQMRTSNIVKETNRKKLFNRDQIFNRLKNELLLTQMTEAY